MKLNDKVAIITGGGTGIGRAIAETFAREGAKVVLVGRRIDRLQEVELAINRSGGSAHAIAADVREERETKRIVDETIRHYAKINILVNNAGIFRSGSVTTTPVSEWDNVFTLNVRGVFLMSRAAIPELEREASSSIINISSGLGDRAIPGAAAYCASKAALNMMTETMALDYAVAGIRVNTISPGVVDTEIHDLRQIEDKAAWVKQMEKRHPLGRIGQPIDIAGAALYLASDDASWVTGTNLYVDGGIHIL